MFSAMNKAIAMTLGIVTLMSMTRCAFPGTYETWTKEPSTEQLTLPDNTPDNQPSNGLENEPENMPGNEQEPAPGQGENAPQTVEPANPNATL